MTLVSMLLKVTLVLGVAAAIEAALARRVSAAFRHLIWVLGLAGLMLLPALAVSLPDWSPVEYTRPAGSVPLLGTLSVDSRIVDAPLPVRPAQTRAAASSLAVAIYGVGVLLLLARVALQHLWAHQLIRASIPIRVAAWQHLLEECADIVGIRRPVRLLRATGDVMPAAVGIWRSAIVLPTSADAWSDDRRRAVLLHELAHIERHDCLTHTLASVACAVYWVHPAVWWVASRLHVERERACDDRVLSAGADARDYAGHLLELAYSLGHTGTPASAIAMARPRELEGRMLAILDTARNRTVPALRSRLAGAAVLVTLTVPVAAATLTPRLHRLAATDLRRAASDVDGQNAATTTERLEFDVASIRRTDPNDPRSGADFSALPGGQLVARNNAVSNFIINAYGIPYYTLIGGPDWMRTERYDLQAKADTERSRPEMMQMLQALLADRFQFRGHRETRELPAYVLTVARGGAKLKASRDDDCVDRSPANMSALPTTETRPGCGNNLLSSRGATPPNLRWSAVHIDMRSVSDALANYFRRPVVDRTGLAGFFDVDMELPPLQPLTGDAAADSGPSVFTVLQEQLGLRVEEGRGPVDVLVVDRIERPTGN